MAKTPLINILCAKLPRDVSQAVFNEYNSRWAEILNIWEYPKNKYAVLQRKLPVVQILLAMSTYYRRVLSGFDGARDFYKTVTRGNNQLATRPVQSISIGTFRLDQNQYNHLLAVQISFNNLRKKFGIQEDFFDYFTTDEFLTHCMRLYNNHFEIEGGSDNKPEGNTNDLPF